MSRGGRGGSSGVRAVANALGIAKHELKLFTGVITESQPTYPPVSRTVAPLEDSTELQYMTELRMELLTRFHDSSFYIEMKDQSADFHRYTDKYQIIEKEKFLPDWSRLPDELVPKNDKVDSRSQKRRKLMDKREEDLAKKLSELEKEEKSGSLEPEVQDVPDENDEESEKEEGNNEVEEQEALSDDDYQEEDNDYIHSYFDNGENYGDVGSDDNLDDDNAF
ncbi:unnamed protein product [Thelazia callipaeda]|uniref:DNA-directed RNA polymerase III subunit n=1 Tax=Thelazia callipaeda TaxID=103827 RepID=A0A0N5CUB1_THECL|nr:unnamed protein product [Thelazia callipaeda]